MTNSLYGHGKRENEVFCPMDSGDVTPSVCMIGYIFYTSTPHMMTETVRRFEVSVTTVFIDTGADMYILLCERSNSLDLVLPQLYIGLHLLMRKYACSEPGDSPASMSIMIDVTFRLN